MSEVNIQNQAANIFLVAAQYIRDYGWQIEGMSCDGKPRCSMGALASAYTEPKWDSQLSELMYKSLYEELNGISLTQFNHKHKNGEKVAKLYECVASKLHSKLLVLT